MSQFVARNRKLPSTAMRIAQASVSAPSLASIRVLNGACMAHPGLPRGPGSLRAYTQQQLEKWPASVLGREEVLSRDGVYSKRSSPSHGSRSSSRPSAAPFVSTHLPPPPTAPPPDTTFNASSRVFTYNTVGNSSPFDPTGGTLGESEDVLFPSSRTHVPTPAPVRDQSEYTVTEERALQRHVLDERLVLMYASLEGGDITSAERIYNRCLRSNLSDMREMIDARVLNAFIEAHLAAPDGPNITRAHDWFNAFDRQISLKHNADSFALLIRHHVRTRQPDKVRPLVEQMELEGVSLQELVESQRFEEQADRTPLEAVLRDMGKDVDGIVSADRLLITAMEESRTDVSESTKISRNSSAAGMDMFFEGPGNTEQQARKRAKDSGTAPMSTQSVGIKVLRKALAEMASAERVDKWEQQQWLEERSAAAAVEDLEKKLENMPENIRNLNNLPKDLVTAWHKVFVQVLKTDMKAMQDAREDVEQHGLERFLALVKPDQLSKITITEFLRPPSKQEREKGAKAGSKSMAQLSMVIGRRVEEEHRARKAVKLASKHGIKLKRAIHQLHADSKLFGITVREIIAKVAKKEAAGEAWLPEFPDGIRARLGAYLVERLMAVARIRVRVPDPNNPDQFAYADQPAFEHVLEDVCATKKKGIVRFHQALYWILVKAPISVDPWMLPMLVTPRPWITWRDGGYLMHRVDMVRVRRERLSTQYLKAADAGQQMTAIQRSLDILGAVPWTINEDMYEVAAALWNKGETVPCLPAPLHIPEVVQPEKEDDRQVWWRYNKEVKARKDKLEQNFGLRAVANYQLEIAKAYLGETMYYPHSLDFRGRAYPMPQHLNHIGNDLCRGLLQFAVGKPLGVEGLRWVKIQVAALAGHDKVSFEERERYTNDHLDDIYDSADHPLDGRRWWLTGDSPWQLLAACKELARALRSPKPIEYVSHLPIHQDGTCNGLQHYAALGGDELGARQVNLIPGEKPADVYSGVAATVQETVNADAAAGVPEAILMKHRVNRKLVKQPVMTNTYGVTYIGARGQIANRLKEARELQRQAARKREEDFRRDGVAPTPLTEAEEFSARQLTDAEIQKCANYTTRVLFDSMAKLFEGARAIQIWLNASAGLIARSTWAPHIPADQIAVAAQLDKMGVLPSPFTVASEESRAAEEAVASSSSIREPDEVYSTGLQSLLGAAMEDDAIDMSPKSARFVDEDATVFEDIADETVSNEGELVAKDRPNKSAAEVAKMTSVVWTTPLGLPVVQPYRVEKPRQIQTLLQTITIKDRHSPSPVNAAKQSTAFPPNYIHSLDAAHMMLSALKCQEANLTFAAVHDSYWTHAATADTMNSILRESFVQLHSNDLMKALRDEFVDRYKGHKIPVAVVLDTPEKQDEWRKWCGENGIKHGLSKTFKKKRIISWVDVEFSPVPARGAFKVEQVLKSKYFFH
ncbi:DNA-directed RNA polymerase [Geranomyces variabilis]|uniref:DNA-directed RNA polymerase n=1 Tax=Geranomyces variabilis TaxID=109894 RepID=A0AAD5TJM0_9FUNG|nr:DNA-directed RNA polymerase [Geranomyces variabilis]